MRAALLVALLDGPDHGYALIQTLTERSGGRWQPSPGAVYPSLEALLDEGLVTATAADGRRVFELTEVGRTAAEERRASGTLADVGDGEQDTRGRLHDEVRALAGASKQVGVAGSPEQLEQAIAIVAEARKSLYRLLADA